MSAQVEINLPALIEAIVGLASNETLRKKKRGENAIKRVKTTYDWSVVIPQMQDVWAHLAEIRAGSAPTTQQFRKTHPTAPPPMAYFSKYPTQLSPEGPQTCKAVNNIPQSVEEMLKLRRYAKLSHNFEKVETISTVLTEIAKHGDQGTSTDIVCNPA